MTEKGSSSDNSEKWKDCNPENYSRGHKRRRSKKGKSGGQKHEPIKKEPVRMREGKGWRKQSVIFRPTKETKSMQIALRGGDHAREEEKGEIQKRMDCRKGEDRHSLGKHPGHVWERING